MADIAPKQKMTPEEKKAKAKAYHQKYYQKHKLAYQAAYQKNYMPKGTPRGRPKKIIAEDNYVAQSIAPIETVPENVGEIDTQLKQPDIQQHYTY